MRIKRRLLSVFLAIVMVVGVLPEMSLVVKADGVETGKSVKAGSNRGRVVVDGTVMTIEPNGIFQVKSDDGQTIIAYISGKMRMNYIRVMPGDRVQIELSPGIMRGRIIYRYRKDLII